MFLVLKKIQDILMVIIDLSDTRSHKPKQSVFREKQFYIFRAYLSASNRGHILGPYSDKMRTEWMHS